MGTFWTRERAGLARLVAVHSSYQNCLVFCEGAWLILKSASSVNNSCVKGWDRKLLDLGVRSCRFWKRQGVLLRVKAAGSPWWQRLRDWGHVGG